MRVGWRAGAAWAVLLLPPAAGGQSELPTPRFEEAWSVEWPGTMLCVAAGDLDGDGQTEVVVGSDDRHVYVVSADGAIATAIHAGDAVREVAVEDLDGRPGLELLVNAGDLTVWSAGAPLWRAEAAWDVATGRPAGSADGYVAAAYHGAVALLDGRGRELWRQSVEPPPYVAQVAMGDLHGDGVPEVVYLGARIMAFDVEGTLLWEAGPEPGGMGGLNEGLAVEDLEGDGTALVFASVDGGLCCYDMTGARLWGPTQPQALRRMVAGDWNGGRERVLAIGSTLWEALVIGSPGDERMRLPVGSHVRALAFADLDRDGRNELLVGSQGMASKVHAVADTGRRLWEQPVGYEVSDLTAADLTGDGRPEVVAAADALYCFDAGGILLWSLGGGSRAKVAAAELNGPGPPEVLVGAAALEAYDAEGRLLWGSDLPYVWTLSPADVDGDWRDEVLATCYDGTVCLVDDDGATRWTARLDWLRPQGVVAELDGQPPPELAVVDALNVYALSAAGERLWHRPASELSHGAGCPACQGICAVAAGDTDGDGRDEVLIGTWDGMRLLDSAGEELWGWQPPEPRAVSSVALTDLDGEGTREAIGLVTGGGVVALDRLGALGWESGPTVGEPEAWVARRPLTVADLDGAPGLEVAACGRSTATWSADGRERWVALAPAVSLTTGDVDGDGRPEVITTGDRVQVLSDPPPPRPTELPTWKSVSVVTADLDGDGRSELLVGSAGVRVWRPAR